jgi:hypothetical protein
MTNGHRIVVIQSAAQHVDYKNAKIKQYHNCDARSHARSEYVGLEVQPMLKT